MICIPALAYAAWVVVALSRMGQTIYHPLPTSPPLVSHVVPTSRPTAWYLGQGSSSAMTLATTPEPTIDPFAGLPRGRVNILVLGTDKRPSDPAQAARSDTMLLANVDTVNHVLRLMSIPRDLVVEIEGYGTNKINAAYFFGEYYHKPGGGPGLAVSTVSRLFNVPVDYYISANFDGFRKVIDTLGGIDLYVPTEIDDLHYPADDEGDPNGVRHVHFDAGWQHMDGKTALRYARTRHADNDFMRSKRQMQILSAVRQKATSLSLLPTLPALIDDLGGMIETNVPPDSQLSFLQLGFSIKSSDIYTSTIDRAYITPQALKDGSEGLKLNWQAARPLLDQFFGRDTGAGALTGRDKATAGSGASVQGLGVATRQHIIGNSHASGQARVQQSTRARPTPAPSSAPRSPRSHYSP